MKRDGRKALALLALLPVSVAWGAWVGAKLWQWFAVPIGAPHIGVMQAAGICLLVHFFAVPADITRTKESDAWEIAGSLLGRPALFLAFGALYRWLAS